MMSIEVKGIDDVKKILEDIAPKRATNLITATMRGVATEIKKEIQNTVTIRTANLKRSVKVKKSRGDKFKPTFKVVFDQGKSAKHDGFYWRFEEHGTSRGQKATNFVRKSRLKIEANLGFIIRKQFTKKLESAIKREMKRQAASK